jgi:hypothetical protein
MLKRAIYAGGVFAIALALSPQAIGQTHNAQPQAHSAKAEGTQSKAGEAPPTQPRAPDQDSGQANQAPRKGDALSIQDHMGRFIWRGMRDPIAVLTLLLFFLGGLQLKDAKDASKRSARAYIFADSVGIRDGNYPGGVSGCPWGTVAIKNSGATPAYETRHFSRIAYCKVGDERNLDLPKDISALVPTPIPPGGSLVMEAGLGRQLTSQEIADLIPSSPGFLPTHLLCVYGKVTYKDAFGKDRETEYRLVYAGIYPPAPGVSLIHTVGSSRAT